MSLIDRLGEILGEDGILLGADVRARPNHSWGRGSCPARAILRPKSTEELSRAMALCFEHEQPVIPWGGLSGLVDGISCAKNDIAVSLERMNVIETIDTMAGTMRVQAGAIVQNIQQAAEDAGWMFAVDFGARGSAQIGGAISTNAGGNSVVRYGMMREQILGLEVVLADGTVCSSLNEMLKNNAGYDLKQLFIGSEGTLGIVTRAVLRLRPAPRSVQTAFLAVDRFSDLTTLLKFVATEFEGKLSAFEVMWNNHYRLLQEISDRHREFLPSHYPFYVLLEQEGADERRSGAQFEDVLETVMKQDGVADALVAKSHQQRKELWAMRDDVEAIVKALDPVVVFDVSLPLRHIEEYLQTVEEQLMVELPEARLVSFGHLGDSNVHLAVGPANDRRIVENIVYGKLADVDGSISAEHGIGLEKRQFLAQSRSDVELGLMRTIKGALDPKNLLNPGKVFE
ncbi:MAG: FAD-binding oxidoreductase [Pseudomonadota bacterium]